ncbi:cytochrome P450 [Phaeosphaeriaceae sp. PMI808]|nr:cytochrome P450 [Phaeosphaeriaceae sp. PMI808]
MNLITDTINVIQGKEYITDLWKYSSRSRALALHAPLLKLWFAMPQKMIEKYVTDDSGYGSKPHPLSSVKPQNRTDRLSHLVFKDVLSGPDTTSLCSRFVFCLYNQLEKLELSTNWTSQTDFVTFVKDPLMVANTEALWGTHLTRTSDFCEDLSNLLKKLHYFTYRLPEWLVPKAFARRARLIHGLCQWQSFLLDSNLDVSPWEDKNYDALKWGSARIRKWQTEFLQMDGADAESLASVHLTFAWAANVNLGPAAFWAVLEIFRDPILLKEVRDRLPAAQSMADVNLFLNTSQARDRICADPLLQSIFTETLRLRVCAFIVRRFPHDTVDLHGWRVPRDQTCLVSTHTAHMQGDGWNVDGGKRPLDRFWAHRFLSPLVEARMPSALSTDPSQGTDSSKNSWSFSLGGLEGVWIPFGGGPRTCPGRHLTKHHIIITMAVMATLFDVDIMASESSLRMSDGNHGFGTLLPTGRVPFRIRRRI